MTDTTNKADATWLGHPRGLVTLFVTEVWERFSFYGMRTLLVLFMAAAVSKGGLGFDDKVAVAIYGLYNAGVYLTGLPGGWIADRLLGQQRAVWYGGIIIAAGHFTLAIPIHGTFFLGLMLIVLGTGLLKPNTSSMVGDLYPDGGSRKDAGYSIYYMGINLGAFLGPLVCGWLGQKVNWHYGFAAAGIGMVAGLITYRWTLGFLGSTGANPEPAHREPERQKTFLQHSWTVLWIGVAVIAAVFLLGAFGIVYYPPVLLSVWTGAAILGLGLGFMLWLFIAGKLDRMEKKHIVALTILFVVQALFWAGYEQAGSNFNLFAERYTDLHVFGWSFPSSWFQSLNPLFIMILAPFFAWFWVWLGKRNLDPNTPFKFALGMLFIGLGFLVMVGAAWVVVSGHKALPTWLALTYLLHTTGELCLSPVGMSATSKLSPRRYRSRLMGTWFLFTALGEVLAGLIAGTFSAKDVTDMPHIYATIAIASIAVAIVLAAFAIPIQRHLIRREIH